MFSALRSLKNGAENEERVSPWVHLRFNIDMEFEINFRPERNFFDSQVLDDALSSEISIFGERPYDNVDLGLGEGFKRFP